MRFLRGAAVEWYEFGFFGELLVELSTLIEIIERF